MSGKDVLIIALYNELIKAHYKNGQKAKAQQCIRHKIRYQHINQCFMWNKSGI